MAHTDSTQQHQTLGQRIDALLSPLYAQADQYRATLDLAKAQIQQLQNQIAAATEGLSRIESQMAQVVRRLAEQDPVLSVLVCPTAVAAISQPVTPTPTDAVPAWSQPQQAAACQHTLPASAASSVALQPELADEPAEPLSAAEGSTCSSVALPTTPGSEVVPLDLDPQTDQAMVDEAAQLLAGPPSPAAPIDREVSATLPPDIVAVAERAAIAARQLREQASATR